MDVDEDDDFLLPRGACANLRATTADGASTPVETKQLQEDEDLEEGEEEDEESEGSDSVRLCVVDHPDAC